jgi:organic radical activating enzyme
MNDLYSLEPAIDPNNRITFLLDWEITKKCNLDCSYCSVGLTGGHDNSYDHTSIDECLKTIDYMYEYVDLYMNYKPAGIKYVILNIYGGEALHHPGIEEILKAVHEKYNRYRKKWNLTVTTTTNAILKKSKLEKLLPYIDEFTTSYHAENTAIQKDWFVKNLKLIKESNRRLKCVILMHPDPEKFNECIEINNMIISMGIKTLPRQLDHGITSTQFNYNSDQVIWFNDLYDQRSFQTTVEINVNKNSKTDLSNNAGRACCGGRQLCKNMNYKSRSFYVKNNFYGWTCSVNHFFLFIRQVDGSIFTNKDCAVNFDNEIGPIGNINEFDKLINYTKSNMLSNSLPDIVCPKTKCLCGLCAPKAKEPDTYHNIMRKYYKL